VRLIDLYFDEDVMQHGLVFALRSHGVTLTTAAEASFLNRADFEHLIRAADGGHVLYSFNMRDYCRLHEEWMQAGREHAGIILAPQKQFSIGEQLRRLMQLRACLSAEDMRNRLEFLTNWE
jgi:hypothetical protein